MDKYLEIFYRGVGESSGLLKANWKMSLPTPLKIICGWYPKSSTGTERDILSCVWFSADQSAILICCFAIMVTSHQSFGTARFFQNEWFIESIIKRSCFCEICVSFRRASWRCSQNPCDFCYTFEIIQWHPVSSLSHCRFFRKLDFKEKIWNSWNLWP